MDEKFLKDLENFNDSNDKLNKVNQIKYTNDSVVDDFLNKNISLESLIENEIYNKKQWF